MEILNELRSDLPELTALEQDKVSESQDADKDYAILSDYFKSVFDASVENDK